MDGPRILVVDDEAGIREGLKLFLEREGYVVKTAGDPGAAIRWIKRARFDCLVIDMDLTRDPRVVINGLDVITLLRAHQPEAKAILMSASPDVTLGQLAEERGAVAHLEKPLDLAALTHLLRRLLPMNGPAPPPSHSLCPSA